MFVKEEKNLAVQLIPPFNNCGPGGCVRACEDAVHENPPEPIVCRQVQHVLGVLDSEFKKSQKTTESRKLRHAASCQGLRPHGGCSPARDL